MKYIIVLGDGMADEAVPELEGKSPLAFADTPMMDFLASQSELGMVQTIPAGMSPGSDTANLAVLGYDPRRYYTGRSPLEALSIGVELEPADIALRCNLVTLSDGELPYGERVILDHSSGEIRTEDAAVLLDAVKDAFEKENFHFHTGTSYRHCLIWKEGKVTELTPPHDILGKKTGAFLPEEPLLREMMEKSYQILHEHPLNRARTEKGLPEANSLWFWGAGTRPILDSFAGKTGKKGAMVSAVDLLKGIAKAAEMRVINVEGADGTLHTNYRGKAEAAVRSLLEQEDDFVYIHIEAPDEMGHQGSVRNKIKAIEEIDANVLRTVYNKMKDSGQHYRMLVLPDHPTPVRLRTHTSSPVPYMLFDSAVDFQKNQCYNEKEAEKSGIMIKDGYRLIDRLFETNLPE